MSRDRHEHQIKMNSSTFGNEFERGLWNAIRSHRGLSFFTDEQVAEIRHEMIRQQWRRHKLNRENRKLRIA